MWLIYLLTLVNAVGSASGWTYPIHVSIGPVELNLFMMCLTLAGLGALLLGGRAQNQYPTGYTHPVFSWLMVLYILAWIVGVYGLWQNGMDPRIKEVGIAVRDFAALPASIFIGYRLLGTPRAADRFAWLTVIAGVGCAVCLIYSFVAGADTIAYTNEINSIRDNAYVSNYAGIASTLLVFTTLSQARLLPVLPSILIAAFCLVGQFAPMNRSDWVSCVTGFAGILPLLPAGRRLRTGFAMVVLSFVLFGALWVGVFAASSITGRDMFTKMNDRIVSLLPTDSGSRTKKAWSTRLPSIFNDMEIISHNPIFGSGFGIQEKVVMQRMTSGSDFHHNAWTDVTAKTGLLGLAAASLTIGSMIVCGLRMARATSHRGFTLIGALGVLAGFHLAMLGMTTYSWNSLRGAILLGTLCGVVLRCRAMQLHAVAMAEIDDPLTDPLISIPDPHQTAWPHGEPVA